MRRPPATRRDPQVDLLHGVEVHDPYRWLEDVEAPDVRRWVAEQDACARAFLQDLPRREAFRARLAEVWGLERRSAPQVVRGTYWFLRARGLAAQAELCRARTPDGQDAEVVVDPNGFAADGTAALAGHAVSPDGRWLAYGRSDAGSDWTTWRVRDLETLADTDDAVGRAKFSGAEWLPDASGFVYSAFPSGAGTEAHAGHEVRLHRRGTPAEADVVLHRDEVHPRRTFWARVTQGGVLVVHVRAASAERNGVWVADQAGDPTRPLFDRFDGRYGLVGGIGRRLWFLTTAGADRGRIVAVDLDRPGDPVTVVPEHPTDTLETASLVGGRLVLVYIAHVAARLVVVGLDGDAAIDLPLPGAGSVVGLEGAPDDTEVFFRFTSWTHPGTTYRIGLAALAVTEVHRTPTPIDTTRLRSERVFVESRDGTRVPAFVSWYGDLVRDGRRPTVLYGYGGFANALLPQFDAASAVWMEAGGVWVVANLRGGNEYGRAWHRAGTRERKQNVFDDYVAVAEHLVATGVTSPPHLGIHGRSNGGLLVGAALVQRPDLFGAALPAVGVLDMLRYHLWTIGWAWAGDYGTADDPEQFRTLLAYSPVHNARPCRYPPVLVTTGDHDDRVVPIHSYKFVAALQAAQQGEAPVLARVDFRAGHGMGKPMPLLVEERADQWAFLAWALGM